MSQNEQAKYERAKMNQNGKADLQNLQKSIAYQFTDLDHLKLALTHRSAHAVNNERHEFLGDAILGSVIACALFEQFSDAKEGKLTRMRAKLVRGETLAEIALELSLQACLILGEGELKAGGRQRKSIRADAVEAIIGAVYLDSDYKTARKMILALYASRLEMVNPDIKKDPKTLLQEALQKRGKDLPEYVILSKQGKAHNLDFKVRCQLNDLDMVETGEGKSRRDAEQIAAGKLLARLEKLFAQ